MKKTSKIYYGWLIVVALFLSMALGIGTRQGFGIFVDLWGSEWETNVSSISLAASIGWLVNGLACLLYTSPSPRDATLSRMPSSA